MNTLNQEEKDLLNSVENEEWESIKNVESSKYNYQNYAKFQINQEKIEIIFSLEDKEKLLQLAHNLGQSTSSLTQDIAVPLFMKYLRNLVSETTITRHQ